MVKHKHNWICVEKYHLHNNPVGKKVDEYMFICPDCGNRKEIIIPLDEITQRWKR